MFHYNMCHKCNNERKAAAQLFFEYEIEMYAVLYIRRWSKSQICLFGSSENYIQAIDTTLI